MIQDDGDTRPMMIYQPEEPTLWDRRDVASYLKASRSWVYHQAERGHLPCLRMRGLLRFDPEALRRFARGQAT
jgi:excisionase family DNA binding protein